MTTRQQQDRLGQDLRDLARDLRALAALRRHMTSPAVLVSLHQSVELLQQQVYDVADQCDLPRQVTS